MADRGSSAASEISLFQREIEQVFRKVQILALNMSVIKKNWPLSRFGLAMAALKC